MIPGPEKCCRAVLCHAVCLCTGGMRLIGLMRGDNGFDTYTNHHNENGREGTNNNASKLLLVYKYFQRRLIMYRGIAVGWCGWGALVLPSAVNDEGKNVRAFRFWGFLRGLGGRMCAGRARVWWCVTPVSAIPTARGRVCVYRRRENAKNRTHPNICIHTKTHA